MKLPAHKGAYARIFTVALFIVGQKKKKKDTNGMLITRDIDKSTDADTHTQIYIYKSEEMYFKI